MTVKEKVQALLAAANGATGQSDADLTAAVGHLIAGQGGGGGLPYSLVETHGEFTPASDVNTMTVAHELGVVPLIFYLWTEDELATSMIVSLIVSPSYTGLAAAGLITNSIFTADGSVQKYGIGKTNNSASSTNLDNVGNSRVYADSMTARQVSIAPTLNTAPKYFKAGKTYQWIAIGME